MVIGKRQAFSAVTPIVPQASSHLGKGFAVHRFVLAPTESAGRSIGSYSLVLHLSRPVIVEWVQSGRTQQKTFQFGDATLHSPGDVPGFRLQDEAELLEIALSPDFVQRTLRDTSARTEEWESAYAFSDARVQYLGLALAAELNTGCPSGSLFCESLATALTAHVFAGSATPLPRQFGGLSRSELQCVIDYIYAHLDQELSLTALAALVSYSPHHFTLLFKQAFGTSPHRFIIEARVEAARRLLASSRTPLGEVACGTGFASQSHFHLHFKRIVGVTPAQYRRTLQEDSTP